MNNDEDGIYETEDDYGDWVKWEDVEKEKFAGIASAIIIIAADLEKKRLKEPECICLGEQEQPTGTPYRGGRRFDCWICPAHGYKKL